jgi:hypothetical protein
MAHSSRLAELCETTRGDATPLVNAIRSNCTTEGAGDGASTSDETTFHVVYADPERAKFFHQTDVHMLSGSLDAKSGGKIRAHCVNNTVGDYTIDVGPAYKPYSAAPTVYHNFTATLSMPSSAPLSFTGRLMGNGQTPVNEVYFYNPSIKTQMSSVILLLGPNPRPRPPPPPSCKNAYNASACAAIPKSDGVGCTWCASKDGVHGLCFAEKSTPNDWNCGAPLEAAPVASILV